MLSAIGSLNESLDKLVCRDNKHLSARIPRAFEGSDKLTWVNVYNTRDRDPKKIRTNTDLEEQFHWMFGPYILDDYVDELKKMLESVKRNRRTHNICSTVKLDVSFLGPVVSLNQIFIRPCLQGHRILGKLILFFLENFDGGLLISNCLPQSASAIRSYYYGDDKSLWDQKAREDGLVTFSVVASGKQTLINKLKDTNSFSYPPAINLNEEKPLDDEAHWAILARLQHEYMLNHVLIVWKYKVGYQHVKYEDFKDACQHFVQVLENMIVELDESASGPYTPDELAKLQILQTCVNFVEYTLDCGYKPHSNLFIPDKDMVAGYLNDIRPIEKNNFFNCIPLAPPTYDSSFGDFQSKRATPLRFLQPLTIEEFTHIKDSLNLMKELLIAKTIKHHGVLKETIGFNNMELAQILRIELKFENENLAWDYILNAPWILRRLSLTLNGDFATLGFSRSLQREVDQFLKNVPEVINGLTTNLSKKRL